MRAARTALVSHGYLSAEADELEDRRRLGARMKRKVFTSYHKARLYLRHLKNPSNSRTGYFEAGKIRPNATLPEIADLVMVCSRVFFLFVFC